MERDGATLIGEYDKLNRDCNIKFICICGKEGEKGFGSVYYKGGLYCKICSTNRMLIKLKNTTLKKYGVENSFQCKEVRDKFKATMIERYGVEYTTQSKELRDKFKVTTLKKYGVEYPLQCKELKDKVKATMMERYGVENTLQSKELRDKFKESMIDKYGVENALQSKEILDKVKKDNLKKYGVHCTLQIEEVKDKTKFTNIKNYGVDNPFKSEKIKNKIKNTNIKKYGAEHPMQNSEIAEKCLKSLYSTKDYNLPSGNIIKVQGYEPFALDKIVKEWNIEEDNIITDRTKVPEIWWNDSNDIRRRYYVDIFIPSKNLVIEVKSSWTMSLETENIKRKIQVSKELGYNTLLWVFNEKGNIVKEYDNCSIEV